MFERGYLVPLSIWCMSAAYYANSVPEWTYVFHLFSACSYILNLLIAKVLHVFVPRQTSVVFATMIACVLFECNCSKEDI